ncbi:Hypothetical protein R9X50_00280700 [Acrodontium crateriforme]|uniref:Uncharacterized protein n=1 Tax=Acrodontium crateriforme TaxID=150365 RepID=A0AAQ3R6Z3_9PEZI|nr:Hypothetical protein R9X50_00280700 [Acrodontium crateriforme]
MSSPPWQDRRGMFQRGKEVHEPARRPSTGANVVEAVRKASVSSVGAIEKVVTGESVASASPSSPISQRRRSSNASGGLFGSLTQAKRGSEDYGERRASHVEQGALTSGWFGSTFRGTGVQKAAVPKPERKGVME